MLHTENVRVCIQIFDDIMIYIYIYMIYVYTSFTADNLNNSGKDLGLQLDLTMCSALEVLGYLEDTSCHGGIWNCLLPCPERVSCTEHKYHCSILLTCCYWLLMLLYGSQYGWTEIFWQCQLRYSLCSGVYAVVMEESSRSCRPQPLCTQACCVEAEAVASKLQVRLGYGNNMEW